MGQVIVRVLLRLLTALLILFCGACAQQNFTCHRDKLPPRGDLICEDQS